MNEQLRELLMKVQSTSDYGYVAFDTVNATNALGDNALHCVCVWGDLEAVKLLVENGININQCGEHGFTPLKVADEFGHNEVVKYLIAHGADSGALKAKETFDRAAYDTHMQRLTEQITLLEEQLSECERTSKGSTADGANDA